MKFSDTINYTIFLAVVACMFACQDPKAHRTHLENSLDRSGDYIEKINAGLIKEDTLHGSPESYAMSVFGNTHMHITYSSPGVKNRIVWGGVVPYGEVWVTGAHQCTTLEIDNFILINGIEIAPGKYAIFTIPERDDWTVIINSDTDQHLADEYDESKDLARFKVSPIWDNEPTPRLVYKIKRLGESKGVISIEWDTLQVLLPFELKI